MFCHGKGLCKNLMEREWLPSLGINVGNLQEIGSRFPTVFSDIEGNIFQPQKSTPVDQ